MTCVITVGLLSSVFGGSSLSSTSSGIGSGGSSGTGGSENLKSVYTRQNGIFFNSPLQYSYGQDPVYDMGGVRLDERITYGKVDTENGYLRYLPLIDDVGKEKDMSILSFFLDNVSSINYLSALDGSKFQVLTIDFDIWSDTGFIPDLYFTFHSSDDISLDSGKKIGLYTLGNYDASTGETGTSLHSSVYTISSGAVADLNKSYLSEIDTSKPLHVTYQINSSEGWFRMYFDGGRYQLRQPFIFKKFLDLSIVIPEHSVKADESICIDNIQVYSYGNESQPYTGDLITDDHSVHISSLTDWILFDEYNKPEETDE